MNASKDKRPRRGLRGAATIVTAWLAGGVVVVAVLLVIGALGGGGTTKVTTVQAAAATTRAVADTSSAAGGAEALYSETSPGVVEIKSKIPATGSEESEAGASPFGEAGGAEEGFAPEGFGGSPEAESSGSTATGSGFEVDDEGTVVTAAHVVDEASSVEVILQDGSTHKAEVLGTDEASDLAVIRFDPEGAELHSLELADSAELNVGASVAAIGAPFEYAWSFSTGVVSGLDRTIEAPNGFTVAHAIQTDAAINPGNSGGPLIDSEGKVIGVVDQIATDGSADQSSGVGFAVPSSLVSAELKQLEAGETVEHAYLGVATASTTEGTAGAAIAEVVQGSPAAHAGLTAGDVITEFDGEKISDTEDLVAAIAAAEPGDTVKLEIERDSKSTEVSLKLGTQPAESSSG